MGVSLHVCLRLLVATLLLCTSGAASACTVYRGHAQQRPRRCAAPLSWLHLPAGVEALLTVSDYQRRRVRLPLAP